jgi:large subunit ribosomal protein L17
MRHGVAGKKLGRTSSQRKALRTTLIRQLFEHERIQTTQAKALAFRGDAEKLITLAKKGNEGDAIQKMNASRLAASRLGNDRVITQKLFDDIAPRFTNRNGGYTRMIKLGPRKGDSAEMVLIELVSE